MTILIPKNFLISNHSIYINRSWNIDYIQFHKEFRKIPTFVNKEPREKTKKRFGIFLMDFINQAKRYGINLLQ